MEGAFTKAATETLGPTALTGEHGDGIGALHRPVWERSVARGLAFLAVYLFWQPDFCGRRS